MVSEITANLINVGSICWYSSDAADKLLNQVALSVLQVGSYLTEPLCKARECYYRIHIVDALNPQGSQFSNLMQKVMFAVSMCGWGFLGALTMLPGIALRYLAVHLMKHPFIALQGESADQTLPPDRSFSLLSWNICGINSGFSITSGGVLPIAYRIDEIINKIVEKNADVNCLYETFDVNTALYIREALKKKGYTHFYLNIGHKPIGVSSGIFIASKYSVKNSEFTPFPEETLLGAAKYSEKGVFAFDLESQGQSFARIYSTHLQHSEEPQRPTAVEFDVRKKQMQIVVDKMNGIRDRCIVLTGDLNLDDDEFQAYSWQHRFHKEDHFNGMKTWGGDRFCSTLVGRPPSGPVNLDHTMVVRGTARSIRTTLLETGFDGTVFKASALSDHEGLFSRISC